MFTAYNDAQTLPNLIERCRKNPYPDSCDIWVVNDGSTDNTEKVSDSFGVYLLNLPKNQGVGTAYKNGFEAVLRAGAYDYLIKIDADGQHKPEFIPKIIECLDNGSGLVVCSRFHPNSEDFGTPQDRKLLNSFFARELSFRTGWDITDARSGFFGVPIWLLKKITPKLITVGYGIPMEITLRSWREGCAKRSEIPHPAIYQNHGNHRRTVQYATETDTDKLSKFQGAFTVLLDIYQDLGILL